MENRDNQRLDSLNNQGKHEKVSKTDLDCKEHDLISEKNSCFEGNMTIFR